MSMAGLACLCPLGAGATHTHGDTPMNPMPFPSPLVYAIVLGLLGFAAGCFIAGSWLMLKLVWP